MDSGDGYGSGGELDTTPTAKGVDYSSAKRHIQQQNQQQQTQQQHEQQPQHVAVVHSNQRPQRA